MRVSVAICTYNGEKYIEQQLESILSQTRTVDEIILCDDGSKDRTVKIASQILCDFPGKWQIMQNTTSKGVADNFVQAYNLCTGDIIFSCDQDDVWKNDKVQKMLDKMDENTVLSFSDADVVDSCLNIIGDLWDGVGLKYYQVDNTEKYSKRVLKSFCVTGATMAFRKRYWESIKPKQLPFLHDIYISLLAPMYGDVKAIPERLILYRRHSETVTQVGKTDSCENNKYSKRFITEYTELKELMNLISSEENRHYTLIKKAKKYHFASMRIVENNNRAFMLALLTREFLFGRYQLFRGGVKLFILDFVFIIKNKNVSG